MFTYLIGGSACPIICHFDDEVILFGVKKSVNVSAKQN